MFYKCYGNVYIFRVYGEKLFFGDREHELSGEQTNVTQKHHKRSTKLNVLRRGEESETFLPAAEICCWTFQSRRDGERKRNEKSRLGNWNVGKEIVVVQSSRESGKWEWACDNKKKRVFHFFFRLLNRHLYRLYSRFRHSEKLFFLFLEEIVEITFLLQQQNYFQECENDCPKFPIMIPSCCFIGCSNWVWTRTCKVSVVRERRRKLFTFLWASLKSLRHCRIIQIQSGRQVELGKFLTVWWKL